MLREEADDGTDLDFGEFPASTYAEWRAETEAILAGAAFEKKLVSRTSEGIETQPIYCREDLPGLSHLGSLPGEPPFVRGTRSNGGWEIAQGISGESAEALNKALLSDLERGQTAINITLQEAAHCDGNLPGRRGVLIETRADIDQILDGVDLGKVALFIQPGPEGLPLFALLISALRRTGADIHGLRGALENDPIGELVSHGSLPNSLAAAFDQMALVTRAAILHMPDFRTVGVHAHIYGDAGGNAVQELAFAVATGVEYLRQLETRGFCVDDTAPRFRFAFSIGADFFTALAKLRAARMLWARIVAASGGGTDGQKMSIHARTSLWNRSALDAHVNLLRGTTEAFAAIAGGCDSLEVGAYDEVIRPADEASRRMARNTQIILRDECHFDHVVDPAGGSYYVETLTDQLARKAWTVFQEIERLGGMAKAVRIGTPQHQVRAVAARKNEAIAERRLSLIGVNVYPDPKERPPEAIHEPTRHAEAGESASGADPGTWLAEVCGATTENLVGLAIAAAAAGARLGELSSALSARDGEAARAEMLLIRRASEPFEKMRAAVAAAGPPKVFLANMGPPRQHKTRADFAASFFQVGGFRVIENRAFPSIDTAAEAASHSGAPIVVICSTDETYPEIVPPLAGKIKADSPDVILVLAGFPEEHVEAFKEAGVDAFIHIRANCYETLRGIVERMGLNL
jgi:methylmalonyl-CoA mutase